MRGLRHLALAIGMFLGLTFSGQAQEFAGLDVGQPFANSARLGIPAGQQKHLGYDVKRWMRPNGIDLSVTGVPGGQIVYMESFPRPEAPAIPGEGLRFKVTTLGKALEMLGAPGFYYTGRGQMATFGPNDVWFHSYALHDRHDVIVTFAFAAPTQSRRYNPDGTVIENTNALLDSMIIADYGYQLRIWGGEAIARPGYQRINLNYQ